MSAIFRSTEKDRVAREAYQQLAAAADEFERYPNPHAARIAAIADRIAETFHLAPQDRKSLRMAARMHDLGEVAMERDYIQRAGSLTDEERIDLQRHPVIGEQEAARASANRDVQLLVRWHHEWWNGLGYPDALRQNEIPLAARILRVADSYAALTDARPYRPALTEEEARTRIVGNAGIEFDPAVVSVLLSLENVAELRSFAKPVEATNATTDDDGWNLFSLFMK
ncbi:MAG TPA: HD domain-containing phosphohydrolase [Pyrinomonadaceae bacterium]|jgi:HD-GYP domain-containing protein (c-di-GMP phosphodiesterase class II)|nr:HD domain-containing phosphohydrolase [Pyrinomonadaceae bacterium]